MATTSEDLYDRLIDEFTDEGVVKGTIFGSLGFMLDGKAVGCVRDDSAAFKLGAGTLLLADALKLDGAEQFDPGRMGRPWRDWIELPLSEVDHFSRLLQAAVANARS
jgi:hypothetical protein